MQPRAHEWQLVFFTILTQMAVGAFTLWGLAALWITRPNSFSEGPYPFLLMAMVLILLVSGTISAGLHLGRPLHAFFAISNLKHSWLSREALLGSSFGLVVLILIVRRWLELSFSILDILLILAGIILGLCLVYSISRLYMLRTVPAWNNLGTPAAFFTTTFLLGTIAVTMLWFLMISWNDTYQMDLFLSWLVQIATLLTLLLCSIQLGIFLFQVISLSVQGGAAADSLRLLWGQLRPVLIWRAATAFLGVGVLILNIIIWLPPLFSFSAFGLILGSEILGRFLFYGFYHREGF
jgi:anaerobic dimethyl sulfoxide reductase subunit C (anchor subunit)